MSIKAFTITLRFLNESVTEVAYEMLNTTVQNYLNLCNQGL